MGHRACGEFLFLMCLEYDGGGSQGDYVAVFDGGPFTVAQDAVEQESAGQTGPVTQCVAQASVRVLLHRYDAVTAVHTPVCRVNWNVDAVTGVVSAYYVVAFLQGKTLSEAEYVFHDLDGAESVVLCFGITVGVLLRCLQTACPDAYLELFAAVFAFEYQRLAFAVQRFVKSVVVVALGASYSFHMAV